MTTQITEHTSSTIQPGATNQPGAITHQEDTHTPPNPQPPVTYQDPIAPSRQDMIDVLMNEIHHLALEQIVNSEFITTRGNTFTIGPNTPKPIVFNRNPDGSITTPDPHRTSLIATGKSLDIFRQTWGDIKSTCSSNIKMLLETRFPLHLKACDGYQSEINAEALRVLANAGYGYFRSPSALGYSKLHQFLGKPKVIRALKFAGSKATLAQFNLIEKNPEAFTQAHEMNPNATVMFLNQIANLRHQTLWDFRNDLTPKEIIGEARKHYPTAPHLWDTFSKLNQRAINHYPPHNRGSHDRGQMYLIAELALESQINPTYSAIKTLSKYGLAIDQLPRDFISAFFRESHHRARNRKTGRTQAQLIREFRDAKLSILNSGDRNPTPQTQITWSQWIESPDPPQHTSQDIQPKKKLRKYSKASPELKIQKVFQNQRLDRLIEQIDVVEITQGSLILESLEGQSVTLRSDFNSGPKSPPLLQITRLPTGAIDVRSDQYWTQDIVLPTPPNRPEPSNYVGPYPTRKINQSWTTHGLATKIARQKAMRAIKATWTETIPQSPKPPSQARITAALNRFWAKQPKELRPWTIDQKLSKSLHEAITKLVDPDTWDSINQGGMDVTRERYNMARTDPNIIRNLQKTNPGALEWAYKYGTPNQEIRHPGQVISTARETMAEHGVDMRHWKTISQTPTDIMRQIVSIPDPQKAVLFLNASVRAGLQPNPTILSDSRNYYLLDVYRGDRTNTLGRENHDTVLEIMYREHAKHSPSPHRSTVGRSPDHLRLRPCNDQSGQDHKLAVPPGPPGQSQGMAPPDIKGPNHTRLAPTPGQRKQPLPGLEISNIPTHKTRRVHRHPAHQRNGPLPRVPQDEPLRHRIRQPLHVQRVPDILRIEKRRDRCNLRDTALRRRLETRPDQGSPQPPGGTGDNRPHGKSRRNLHQRVPHIPGDILRSMETEVPTPGRTEHGPPQGGSKVKRKLRYSEPNWKAA